MCCHAFQLVKSFREPSQRGLAGWLSGTYLNPTHQLLAHAPQAGLMIGTGGQERGSPVPLLLEPIPGAWNGPHDLSYAALPSPLSL